MLIWIVIAIIGAAGTGMLTWGARGQRINDHPICRGCRFDLVGLFPGAKRCPECGRVIVEDGAVRVGTRVRRRSGLVVGAVLLLLAMGGGGIVGWASATGFDWNTVKPTSLLVSELASRDAAAAEAAAKELTARLTASGVTRQQAGSICARILERQADTEREWPTALGELFDALRGAKLVGDAQWEQYLINAAQFTVRVRPVVRRDAKLVLHPSVRFERMHRSFGRAAESGVRYRLVSVAGDGEALPTHSPGPWNSQFCLADGMGTITSATTIPTPREAGVRTIRSTWALAVFAADDHQGYMQKTKWTPEGVTVSFGGTDRERTVEFAHTVTVTDDAAPDITMVRDAAIDAWLVQNIEVQKCRLYPGGPGNDHLDFVLRIPRPPVDIAAQVAVVVMVNGKRVEFPAMSITARSETTVSGFGWSLMPRAPTAAKLREATHVSLIIRSDAGVAEETVDMERIWDGEVKIEGIAVGPPGWP